MTTSIPKRITSYDKRLLYKFEATAGTLETAGYTVEPCRSITTKTNRQTEKQMEYFGAGASLLGEDEMNRHAQTDIEVATRVGGLAAQGIFQILGQGSDAGGTNTHTGHVRVGSTAMDTMSLMHDMGDKVSDGGASQNLWGIAWGTLQSIDFTVQPNGNIPCKLQYVGLLPVPSSAPTITTSIGVTTGYTGGSAARLAPYKVTYSIYGSGGTYTVPISQGNITLSRKVTPDFYLGSKDPQDFTPEELILAGGFTARFDGANTGSIIDDARTFGELGSNSNQHSITFAYDASHSIVFTFWPLKLNDPQIDESGRRAKVRVSMVPYNDMGTALGASPAFTIMNSVVVKNDITTAMG